MLPRAPLLPSALVGLALIPASAFAAEPAPPPAATPTTAPPTASAEPTAAPATPEPEFDESLVLDTGRVPVAPPVKGEMRLQVHGEYQLRGVAQSNVPLEGTFSGAPTALGQKKWLHHWLRITPRAQVSDWLEIVGQLDFPRGMIAGDTTQEVWTAAEPRDARKPFGVDARWLYVQVRTPIGLVRAGQQGSHWGMGILANDGDHPRLFGDYRRGNISERLLFATKPLGKDSPLTIAAAGDLVYRDQQADLTDHDRAWQGILAALYESGPNALGVYGVYRHQSRDREGIDELSPFTESLNALVLDATGKLAARVPGAKAFVYGQFEGTLVRGDTSYVRTSEVTAAGEREKIRSYGGALELGAVHERGAGKERWGDVAVGLEWGWASGDANPYDGTTKRFTFDPNHTVGLVLFDHVLAWKSARAAVAAADPALVARPTPGTQWLPSNGGVFGATYLNPTAIVRPTRDLDLKVGVVIAQSTADVVDPYRVGVTGRFRNWDGGDAKRHDLGVELDGGVEWRIRIPPGLVAQVGAQGGVLFPGGAFEDATGNRLATQYVGVGRLGLQY